MSDLIYKPAAVKHFRRLAEDWRAKGRDLTKSAKTAPTRAEQLFIISQAELYEMLGKELKELASDVLNNRVGCL